MTKTNSELPISEVARFFGRSIAWIRLKEREKQFVREDGSEIVPSRTSPRKASEGQRRYSLQDIDEMADSLLRLGQVSQAEFESIKEKVKAFS